MFLSCEILAIAAIGFMKKSTVAQGQEATFHCQHSTADAVVWKLNDIALNSHNSSFVGDIAVRTSYSDGVSRNTLTLPALPKYNQTRIECVAFSDGSAVEHIDTVILTIQGLFIVHACS